MLVVEDEVTLQDIIRVKLEKNKFSVITARTKALTHLRNFGMVDAIWLDHYLFGQEAGLDFLTAIRAEGSPWRTIPVFTISNTASDVKKSSYAKLGVEKYYVKSDFRLSEIIEDIRTILDRKYLTH